MVWSDIYRNVPSLVVASTIIFGTEYMIVVGDVLTDVTILTYSF